MRVNVLHALGQGGGAVCHTVNPNPILRFLYWNMNYHTGHHMYAAVPFFSLPKRRAVIENDVRQRTRTCSRA
ncbi:MAG TPA: fatty acid desaturase [Spirochaetia bacterium]|nr:fatty acid desaturase [Spirochaetia bacterium]